MSSYDNKPTYTDEDDELEFDFINDDYGFDEYDSILDNDTPVNSSPDDNNTKNSSQKPVTFWSEVLSYVKILVAAVIIAFIFSRYVIVNAEVPTGSMKSTIMEHDKLIGFRLSYLFSEPKRGDIVIFKYPDNEAQNYVKRVIGTPGDVVQIKGGQVYVNGDLLEEDYLYEPMQNTGIEETYVVPEGYYFMMGDNRNSSLDSRYWKNTYVAKNKIIAKVIFKYYDGYNEKFSFRKIQ
ncbi:MAG: signal peptidase I [Lachnospira sp.]|nr:signal peptidase I [Lachnospira sp.]